MLQTRCRVPFEPDSRDTEMNADIETTIHTVVYHLPASNNRLDEIRQKTAICPELSLVRKFLMEGFPVKCPTLAIAAYKSRVESLIDADGIMLMDGKIVIPVSMRPYILTLIHEGHQGIKK